MKNPYTKEQLLDGIRIMDDYFERTEDLFEEVMDLIGDEEVPDDLKEEYEEMMRERVSMRINRLLFKRALLIDYGINIDKKEGKS